jgi:hypothetical protein
MKTLFSGFNKEEEPDPTIQVKKLILQKKSELCFKERELDTISNKSVKVFKENSHKSKTEREKLIKPLLTQKRILENDINTRRNAVSLLEKSINLLEESKMNQQVVGALQNVNSHIKKTTVNTDIDKMSTIMDDFHESIQDVQEISSVLENPEQTNDKDLFTDFYNEIENNDIILIEKNNIVIEEKKDTHTEQNFIDLYNLKPINDVISFPAQQKRNQETTPKNDIYQYLKNMDF